MVEIVCGIEPSGWVVGLLLLVLLWQHGCLAWQLTSGSCGRAAAWCVNVAGELLAFSGRHEHPGINITRIVVIFKDALGLKRTGISHS